LHPVWTMAVMFLHRSRSYSCHDNDLVYSCNIWSDFLPVSYLLHSDIKYCIGFADEIQRWAIMRHYQTRRSDCELSNASRLIHGITIRCFSNSEWNWEGTTGKPLPEPRPKTINKRSGWGIFFDGLSVVDLASALSWRISTKLLKHFEILIFWYWWYFVIFKISSDVFITLQECSSILLPFSY